MVSSVSPEFDRFGGWYAGLADSTCALGQVTNTADGDDQMEPFSIGEARPY
ncbi:hypothetical protein H8Z60_29570 [Mycolicibacterium fortuitum]|nr:hypothetical protein [Mycolicibacterium fortuitum]